jgi:GTP1/Obg family GTP-binding protein
MEILMDSIFQKESLDKMFMSYQDEIREDINRMFEREYTKGSYLDTLADVSRYTKEAKVAIVAARKSIDVVKESEAYKTAQVKSTVDILDKAMESVNNIMHQAIANITKLGG